MPSKADNRPRTHPIHDFLFNASAEETEKVYKEVLEEVACSQKAVIEAAKVKRSMVAQAVSDDSPQSDRFEQASPSIK